MLRYHDQAIEIEARGSDVHRRISVRLEMAHSPKSEDLPVVVRHDGVSLGEGQILLQSGLEGFRASAVFGHCQTDDRRNISNHGKADDRHRSPLFTISIRSTRCPDTLPSGRWDSGVMAVNREAHLGENVAVTPSRSGTTKSVQ